MNKPLALGGQGDSSLGKTVLQRERGPKEYCILCFWPGNPRSTYMKSRDAKVEMGGGCEPVELKEEANSPESEGKGKNVLG